MEEELIELRIEKDQSKVTVTVKDWQTNITLREELYGVDQVENEGVQVVSKKEAMMILSDLREACKDAFCSVDEDTEEYEDEEDEEIEEDIEDEEDDSSSGLDSAKTVLAIPAAQASKQETMPSKNEEETFSYVTAEHTEETIHTLSNTSSYISDDEFNELQMKKFIEPEDSFYEKPYKSDWAIAAALFGTGVSLLGFIYVVRLYQRIIS